MPTKKNTNAAKPAEKKAASLIPNETEIAGLVETVAKKLTGDTGLLEKFKTNAMAVVKKLLPNIKDTNILNAIITAVTAKLNLGDLLGAIGGKDDKKDDKKEEGGLLNSVMGLFTGK